MLGPILSPAKTYEVFDDIEDETLPPLSSISFLSSFLDKVSKTPETTKVFPSSLLVWLAKISADNSNCIPKFLRQFIILLFSVEPKKSTTLSAILSPISSTLIKFSVEAKDNASILL